MEKYFIVLEIDIPCLFCKKSKKIKIVEAGNDF